MPFFEHLELTWTHVLCGALLFLIGLIGSIAVVVAVLIKLPATYFRDRHPPAFCAERHPVLRWSGLVGKNLLGILVILLGISLSLPGIPGQGLLMILLGIMLLDFPGKRRLEQKLVSRPKVLRSINWLRDRFGKSPLVLESEASGLDSQLEGTQDKDLGLHTQEQVEMHIEVGAKS